MECGPTIKLPVNFKDVNTPSVKRRVKRQIGSIGTIMYRVTLGNESGTDFGASQCIPMGPCLMLPLLLTLDAPLDARCGYSLTLFIIVRGCEEQ